MDAEKALNEPLAVISSLLRTRSLSVEALTQAALDQASKLDWKAYRHVRRDTVLSEARLADQLFKLKRDLGPLQGIPISVKDLYGIEGEQTFAGTCRALPPRFESSGPFLGSALKQMAIILGKTHTVEFAFGGIGTNKHWPTPYNPWSESKEQPRVPGGSSSGAGVSLCEGSARVAFGTDTAGSVRIPAAWTGNVGLKTSKDRWPTKGIVPLSTTLDTPGILVRTVDDLIYVFNAIDSAELPQAQGSLSGIALARSRKPFDLQVADDILVVIERALKLFVEKGASLIEQDISGTDEALDLFNVGGPTAIELQRFLQKELPDYIDGLDPNVRARLDGAAQVPEEEYQRRLTRLKAITATAKSSFDTIDFFVTPTVANRPPKLSELVEPQAYKEQNLLALRNTAMVSFLGLCAITIPVGVDACGLPVGLQIIAPPNHEEQLILVAASMESAVREASFWTGYTF